MDELNMGFIQADSTHQAIWLKASENNSAFYERHGFVTADKVIIGDDSPDWKKVPTVIMIVCQIENTNHISNMD